MGFGSRKADEFCARKSKSSRNKNAAETFEAVVESSRIPPVEPSDISGILSPRAINDYPQNDESDNSRDFDRGEEILHFSKRSNAKHVGGDDENEEKRYECHARDVRVPELKRQRRRHNF